VNPRFLNYDGRRILFRFPYDEDTVATVKSIGGRWSADEKVWWFPPDLVRKVVDTFGLSEAEMSETAKTVLSSKMSEEARRQDLIARKADGRPAEIPDLPDGWKYVSNPYHHQEVALALSSKFSSFALLCEMGTGKTKPVLDLFRLRWKLGQARKLIVLCPKSVVGTWKEEIAIHTKIVPEDVFVMKEEFKAGKTLAREDLLIGFLKHPKQKVAILHYDLLRTFPGIEVKDKLNGFLNECRHELGRTMLAIDESTRIKSPSAMRTKVTHKLCRSIPYRVIMTGVFISKDLLDIHSQWYAVDLGEALGQSFKAFRENLFFTDKSKYHWFPKPGTKDLLTNLINGQGFRIRKAECLDLPPKVYSVRRVEMGKDQERLYQKIKEEMFVQIDGETIGCSQILTKLAKLAEVTSGFVMAKDGTVVKTDNPKMAELEAILDEAQGSKAVVFAVHRHAVETITEKFRESRGAIALYGKTSDDAEAIVRRFQNDPDCRLLVANQASGGIGISLTAADLVIYFSNSFSLEERLQSEDRCHRIGSEKFDKVTIVDIVVPGTIDDAMLGVLTRKDETKRMLLDGHFDYRKLTEGRLEIGG